MGLGLLLVLALGMRLYRLEELPPGLFHDEAYNTLDAQALAEGLAHPRFYDSWEVYARTIHTTWPPPQTRLPVFLEGNYGREPLFHYLGALVVALVGPRVWALRLVAALAGTLAVLAAYLVTRELFSDEPGRATRLALLAAAVATGVYSLLAFSRLGLRIITLVTLEGLTVALWWRAGRDGRLRWWALAGLLLGLAQYTYIPARLLPLIAAYPVLVWFIRRPRQRPQLMRGTLLASLAALAVTAPLILFFARYPAYLTLRAEAISADAAESGPAMIVANLGRVVGGLVWRGDPNPILNLPGRPALDAAQSVFFLVGLIVCLERIQKPGFFRKTWFLVAPSAWNGSRNQGLSEKPGFSSPWRGSARLPCSLLVLWAVSMHIPSMVSGVAPTFGRSIGAMLPVVVITAVGMEATWAIVVTRWPRLRWLATLVVLGVLVFSVGRAAGDYFAAWAELPNLPQIFHEEMAAVGRYIGGLPDDAVVYITPTQKYYATLLVAMQEYKLAAEERDTACWIQSPTVPRDRPRDFYGPAGLLPAGDPRREAVYLILEGDDTTAEVLETALPAGRWDAQDATFAAYRVPPGAHRAQLGQPVGGSRRLAPLQADFGGLVRLLAFDPSAIAVHPGDVLSVRLTWQALAAIDRRYTAFVHLLGPPDPATGSPLWAQDDHEPGQATYSTDRWFSGEVVMDNFHIQVPADAPAGAYTLSTGFYDLETLERLPCSALSLPEGGGATDDTVTMTTITLLE